MLINLIFRNVDLRKTSFFCMISAVFLISGCTYDRAESTPTPPTITLSYNIDIKPIIEINCNSCHSTSSTDPEKPGYAFFDDFEELKRYALKESTTNPSYTKLQARIRHIEFPGMPFKRARLSESDIQKIEDWIKVGAPNN